MSEPEGRDGAWTDERGTSEEGRRRPEAPRRRAEQHSELERRDGERVSPAAAVDEALGSHPDPLAPDQIVSPGTAVDEALGSHPDPPAGGHQPRDHQRLSHLDSAGQARMVDVSAKNITARSATATGRVLLSAPAVAALLDGTVPKGDALAVARIAAIQGAKRTPDLVPLCHPIGLHGVAVDLSVGDGGVAITVTARTADRTGVEMEALTAVAAGALALIDMVKAIDPAATITDVMVTEKTGGKTGHWRRP
jgi:cyclic pyranopterin phosphate synthase